jgi:cell division protein FtsB
MKRAKIIKKRVTIINIVLGVCLLGAIGWGTFNYISLGQTIEQQQQTIEQQKDEITLLNNQIGDLQGEVFSLNVRLTEQEMLWRDKLKQAQAALEAATFELGKDMLVKPTSVGGFDCDDSALYMYLYFTNLGYNVRIVKGNLDLDDETFWQCNHVWVWVNGGAEVGELAYDWGHFYDDEQHSRGYVLNYEELLRTALVDQK